MMTRRAVVVAVTVMSASRDCGLTTAPACPLPLPRPLMLSSRCVLWVGATSALCTGSSESVTSYTSLPGRSVIESGNTIMPRVEVSRSVVDVVASSIFVVRTLIG